MVLRVGPLSFTTSVLLIELACLDPQAASARDRQPECVPFARTLSSIRLLGDAWRWWSAASGLYNRGTKPEAGAILSFRPDARMPLGHIAVVTRVAGQREIEVDHANWIPGAVSRQVQVVDVSAGNDWTAVRVELSERDRFGTEYATNGFIYGWPIELGAQIIDVSEALRSLQGDRSQSTSGTRPVVIGPRGVMADNLVNGALPVVIYGRYKNR